MISLTSFTTKPSANNPTTQPVTNFNNHVHLLFSKINLRTAKRGRSIASPSTWLSIDTRLRVSGPATESFTPKYMPRPSERSTNSAHRSTRSGMKCTSPSENCQTHKTTFKYTEITKYPSYPTEDSF